MDSSGWIEYVIDGPNAGDFEAPLLATDDLLVPSVSILEVYRWVLRERGRPDALEIAAAMRQCRVIDLDATVAVEAAETGASLGLPMADSIIYAVAQMNEATLWTQDSDFETLGGVRYFAKRTA